MKNSNFLCGALIGLICLSSCQSLQPVAVDYLQPARLSVAADISKVALLDHTCQHPEFQQTNRRKVPLPDRSYLDRTRAVAQSNAALVMEALAEEMAQQQYFDSIVIQRTPLRTQATWDRTPVRDLSEKEVQQLVTDLHVDLLVVLENLPLYGTCDLRYLTDSPGYLAIADVKTVPTVSVYDPRQPRSPHRWQLTDSLSWESYGESPNEATFFLPPEEERWEEAADFTGTLLARYLVPSWEKGKRYLFANGSVHLRDAAVYVRENNWNRAAAQWQAVFEQSKSKYQRMKAAHNLAVYCELTDQLPEALQWAEQAAALAEQTSRKAIIRTFRSFTEDIPSRSLIQHYVGLLKERKAQLPVLNRQMKRFEDNF